MADTNAPTMQATLGLTGLTMNAMALIAPGAFLWLTFQIQALYGAPMAGSAMWFGIVAALLLCFATAISYADWLGPASKNASKPPRKACCGSKVRSKASVQAEP